MTTNRRSISQRRKGAKKNDELYLNTCLSVFATWREEMISQERQDAKKTIELYLILGFASFRLCVKKAQRRKEESL
jgi:hypothetical protein